MDKEFLKYYEDELQYMKKLGEIFAKAHPKIAGRLKLEDEVDPHTERLIEAFSFLTARINRKLDDQFTDIIESLFNILFPQYNRPTPSFCVVQFNKDQIPKSGYPIPRKTELFVRNHEQYKFNTCFSIVMHPIKIDAVSSQYNTEFHSYEIKIKIVPMMGNSFSGMKLDSIRFNITDNCSNKFKLYDFIHNHQDVKIKYTDVNGNPVCKTVSLSPVGFESNESMYPFHDNELSFPGLRMLNEYFNFPEKFLFFDIKDFKEADNIRDFFEICIYHTYSDRHVNINIDTFCLNATPAINIFERSAHITIDHKETEYPLIPGYYHNQDFEVFSVEDIWETKILDSDSKKTIYKPFCSFYHFNESNDNDIVFWNVHRRISMKKADKGSDVCLSFHKFKGKWDQLEELVHVKMYCTNRKTIEITNETRFHITKGVDIEDGGIECIKQPAAPMQTYNNADLKWRFLSHLAINLSTLLTIDTLKEILYLYNTTNSETYNQMIEGICKITVNHTTRKHKELNCFYRGLEVSLWINEDFYVDNSLILFSNVLDFFFGQFVSINSFSQLIVKSYPDGKEIKQWEQRNGYKTLL